MEILRCAQDDIFIYAPAQDDIFLMQFRKMFLQ